MTGPSADAYAIQARGLNLWYGSFQALKDVTVGIRYGLITSLIGPSGCGKTTLLRCFNRVNERYGDVRTSDCGRRLEALRHQPECLCPLALVWGFGALSGGGHEEGLDEASATPRLVDGWQLHGLARPAEHRHASDVPRHAR